MDLQKHFGKFDIVYADPPWPMWGSPDKNAAAGKHYSLMTMEEICAMPVKSLFRDLKKGVLFLWATCPRLDLAFEAINAWGLNYRGVAFVWVKIRKDRGMINGQGIPPTTTKPTTELCLAATTNKTGRPFPLLDASVPQVVFAPRGPHSAKPEKIRSYISQIFGSPDIRPSIELFSRQRINGWEAWGDQVPEEATTQTEVVPDDLLLDFSDIEG